MGLINDAQTTALSFTGTRICLTQLAQTARSSNDSTGRRVVQNAAPLPQLPLRQTLHELA